MKRSGEQESGDRLIERDRVIGKATACDFSVPPRLRGEISLPITRPPDPEITRSASPLALLRRIMQTIQAALREIFDESSYERFLLRTKSPRSMASYRDFTREREKCLARRPRCC